MKENITKKQHYVTVGILKFFTNTDGKFFEFLVEDVNKKPYQTNPNDAMSAKFVYEHDSLIVNEIEDVFANSIDAKVPSVIREIICKIEESKKCSKNLKKVSKKIFNELELFLMHYYRSGALLTEFSFSRESRKIALMLRKILDKRYIELLSKAIKDFYNFAIIESDDNFLISDQYISTAAIKVKSQFIEVSNRNIGLKETIIFIPLSSKYYVVFWNSSTQDIFQESEINFVEGLALENINRVILNNSYKKCIGHKKSVCEGMQNKFERKSPSGIITTDFNFTKKKEVFWNEQDTIFWQSFKDHKFPEKFNNKKRNALCSCGSGKKFKKCHYHYSEWWNNIIETWGNSNFPFIYIGREENKNRYVIKNIPIIEGPIDQY